MEYYLVVSSIMFFAGIYGFITRKNLIAVLISVELVLTSTDINFAVFNRFLHRGVGSRNGGGDRHHHQHLPQYQEYGSA